MHNSNSDVFARPVKPRVDAAIEDSNATIFTCGQTSSGKTYTMVGNKQECGIIQLTVQHMFQVMKQSSGCEFLARASYLEINNEKVRDLLREGKGSLKIREMDGNITGINLKEDRVASFEKIIECQSSEPGDKRAIQVSHLNLIDLAGSERAEQSGATGDILWEGSAINQSLLMLGHFISKLSGQKQHDNLQESNLTLILQPSLNGNALILTICTDTPAAEEETLYTLRFASQARMLKVESYLNEFVPYDSLLERYTHRLEQLSNDYQDVKIKNVCQHLVTVENKQWKKCCHNKIIFDQIRVLKEKLVSHGASDHREPKKRSHQQRTRFSRTSLFLGTSTFSVPQLETIEEEPSFPQYTQSFSESDLNFHHNQMEVQLPLEDFQLEYLRQKMKLDCTSLSDEELVEEPVFMSYTDSHEETPVGPVETTFDVSCQTELAGDNSSEPNGTPQHELRERINFWQKECELQRIEFEEEKQFVLWEKVCLNNPPDVDQHQNFTLADIIIEENSQLREEVSRKNAVITGLQEQLSKLQPNVSELWQTKEALHALQDINSKALENVSEKSKLIATMKEKLTTFHEKSLKCQNIIAEKDNKIQLLEKNLSKYAFDITKKENVIEDLRKEVFKYICDLTGKDNRIKDLNEQLNKCTSIITEKDNRVQELQVELSKCASCLAKKENEFEDLEDELSQKVSYGIERDNRIKELGNELSKFTSVIAEKDQKIERLNEEVLKYVSDITERDNKIQELSDLLLATEEKLQEYLTLSSEKDIIIKDLNEKKIAMEAIMSMAKELERVSIPEKSVDGLEMNVLQISAEANVVVNEESLDKSCENAEMRGCYVTQPEECPSYFNISEIEQAIFTMQQRILALKKRTADCNSIVEIIPDNGMMWSVSSKEMPDADYSTNPSLFDTEVKTYIQSENCYLKSLLVHVVSEIHRKQLQLNHTKDEREKINTEVKSLRSELHKLQLLNKNPSLSAYDLCLELLKQQTAALQESLDEIRAYRKCLVNEVADLDPNFDQQSLQECELTELLGIFNKCIIKKEEEVFSDLHNRCEELTCNNNTLIQLIQALEYKIQEKDQEIKSLSVAINSFEACNETLVNAEDSICTKKEIKSENLQGKLVKEEVNSLTVKLEELGKVETFSSEIQYLFSIIPELDSENDLTSIISIIIEKVSIAKALNDDLFVLKNQYAEVNKKNASLKRHIECLEMDLQEKEEENKDLLHNVKNLQNDKDILTAKINEKVRTTERLEQEVKLVQGELSLVKHHKDKVESLTSRSQHVDKLELIIEEVKQLLILFPDLECSHDSSLLTAIPLLKQKLSMYVKINENNFVLNEQITELNEKYKKMKENIEILEFDVHRKTHELNEIREMLSFLQNEKETLLIRLRNQAECLEALKHELKIAKACQPDVRDLKDELLSKSQQLEKLEIINVEIQQLITSALERNVSPDCDLVTTVHLLIQKIGHAKVLAEELMQYKENLNESEIQCEKLKNHIKLMEHQLEGKNTKIKELADTINTFQSLQDKHLLEMAANVQSMSIVEHELKVIRSEGQSNYENEDMMNKVDDLEQKYPQLCQASPSIPLTDIVSLDHLFTDNDSKNRENLTCFQDQTAGKKMKCKVTQLSKHDGNFSRRVSGSKKEINAIQTLQTNNSYLQHQMQYMKKEIENVLADQKKLELQLELKDKEINALNSARKRLELEVQYLKKRARISLEKQKEVQQTIDQKKQEIENVFREKKEFESQYLQTKKAAEIMKTIQAKLKQEVIQLKTENEKQLEEMQRCYNEIDSLKVDNENLQSVVQHLRELETAENKIKELFTSIPDVNLQGNNFASAINFIIEKINSKNFLKQDNANVEKNTQIYHRLKKQVRDLDKVKKQCLDLEEKVDFLEHCRNELEMKLTEKNNITELLKVDKVNLKTKINSYSERLQVMEQYLTGLGFKWNDKLMIYCVPPIISEFKVLQLRIQELEEQVSNLKMELKQKNMEYEGAYNLASDLDKEKYKYETKYYQAHTEMLNLQCKLHCLQNNVNLHGPGSALVSIAVNTDESECTRCKVHGREIHQSSICNDDSNCGNDTIKLEITSRNESDNLEKCLAMAKSEISESRSQAHNLPEIHSKTSLTRMKHKFVQTDEESLVIKRLCSEGYGVVPEQDFLQALERVKKLEKEIKMLKALSREQLRRLHIAEGKIKPSPSSKSTVPRLSPEKLTILERYARDVCASTSENGNKKNITTDQ